MVGTSSRLGLRGEVPTVHEERDFKDACRYLMHHEPGAFYTDRDEVIIGKMFGYESETDSPNGIPCVSLQTASGAVVDVYEDDFLRATFPDEET
jgi:hypothetical protein